MAYENNLKLICGLWQGKTKQGAMMLKGKTQHTEIIEAGHSILIFANGRRTKDTQPEFFLYTAPPVQGKDAGMSPAQEGGEGYKVKPPPEEGNAGGGGDKVPF